MILLKIFWVFFKISICAFGGAYSFLPLLEKELVENCHWIDKQEYLDILAVVQMFPGAISIKYATYVGYKIGGVWGMLAANIGNVVPALCIIMVTAHLYYKYRYIEAVERAFEMVRAAIIAMVIGVFFKLIDWGMFTNLKMLLVFMGSLSVFIFFKIHPAFVIIFAAFLGIILK